MKEFRAIFPISSILVIRSGYAKKGHFPILAVFQNVWDLHNLGCRFEFRTQKLPYERISDNFSNFTDFHAKKDHFSILAVIQNIWDLHKFGQFLNISCRFEFRTQKLPYETILGNFFDFVDFGHQDRVLIQKIWDLHKFGLQI